MGERDSTSGRDSFSQVSAEFEGGTVRAIGGSRSAQEAGCDWRRELARWTARIALALIIVLAKAPAASAIVAPDPSGLWESTCYTGPAFIPVSCDGHSPAPRRAYLRLYASQFTPQVGSCSFEPCTPARMVVEGQMRVPRTLSYIGEFDEVEQKCNIFPDWPRVLQYTDVYDVYGESLWSSIRDVQVPQDYYSISFGGGIISDPGEWQYFPRMKVSGPMYWGEALSSSTSPSEVACATLVRPPAMRGSLLPDGPAEQDPPRCGGNGGTLFTNCWRRISGAIRRPHQTLHGKAVSLVPTYTETDYEVHDATIVVYEQELGRVRDQDPDESESSYLSYLRLRGRREVFRTHIFSQLGGGYTFGEPGRFEIPDVPIFRFLADSAANRWGTVFYTVEVDGAATREEIPEGDEGETRPHTLNFKTGRAVNVVPEDSPITIGLAPFSGIQAKLELAGRILTSEACTIHYSGPETDVLSFLVQYADMELSPEVDEGIRRALWAERAVLGGMELADQLVDTSLAGLGAVLADLWSDYGNQQRADIREKKKARDRLEQPVDPLVASSFKLDSQPLALTTLRAVAGTGDGRMLARIDLASMVKRLLKGFRPQLVSLLETHGTSDAAEIADRLIAAAVVVADAFENRTSTGAAKSLIKDAIKQAVKLAKEPLLDIGPFSYCGLTAQSLETSVDQMKSWNSENESVYHQDRNDVVKIIAEMNREASDVLARKRAAQEIAAGFDATQNAAAAFGVVFKFAKAIEKFSNASKYALNIDSFISALAEAFGSLPDHVENAVAAAYGLPAPSNAPTLAQARFRGASSRLVVPAGHAALVAVLTELEGALADDDIGEAIRLLADPETSSYVDERNIHERKTAALFVQAAAATGSYNLDAPLKDARERWFELQVAQEELAERLRLLVANTYAGQYGNPQDAGYRRDRDAIRALLRLVADSLPGFSTSLGGLGFAVQSNGIGPAVLVEALAPVSNSNQESFVSASPETFTFRARVTNLGDTPLSGLSLRLAAISPLDSFDVAGPVELPVAGGTLQAFDGLDESGGDEAVVEWQVTYNGDFSSELLMLGADLLQDGVEPAGITTTGARETLPLDASVADQDLDGLPDDFEAEFGLDLLADDAGDDLDDDGLSNIAELDIGTNPALGDSDGDGLDDGEELFSGQDGFVTAPLLADTDGDGISDSADGNPVDGGSSTPPEPQAEPSVELSKAVVTLDEPESLASVTVDNGGSGELIWAAAAEHPALLDVSPALDDLRSQGGTLFVSLPAGFDLSDLGVVVSTVDVTDASGVEHDSARLIVVIGEEAASAVCGHSRSATIGGSHTATDALGALRAGVGLVECAPCQCDVDSSGSVSASDALRILRVAVGVPLALACPAC